MRCTAGLPGDHACSASYGFPMSISPALRTRSVFLLTLALWALAQWLFARPPSIAADWQGWRQADTQAIALNFRDSGHAIFYPQIDWRGDGAGFVETEFQLYTYLTALLLPAHENPEWPGQLLSLAAIALAAALIFVYLSRLFSPGTAALAALFMLANLGAIHLATSVQPDALCFLFYAAALIAFHRFLSDRQWRWLWLSAAA
jgi:hypothetical protein